VPVEATVGASTVLSGLPAESLQLGQQQPRQRTPSARGRVDLHQTQERGDQVLGIPLRQIRVIPTMVGGASGGMIWMVTAPLCVLLAQKSGRPVRIELRYEEEFLAGRPRVGCTIRMRTASSSDGLAPATSPSAGSRMTYSMGNAARLAAIDARAKLLAVVSQKLEVAPKTCT
jgi:CO/xanthine dehydrogenase Mo-binding subunit